MADYILTASSLIAVILCIIPGIFHLQTRNWMAIFMTIWVLLTNMIIFINSILWANDLNNKVPAYCYVTAPLYNAAHFGILTSTVCMIHTLHNYVVKPTLLTERYRRRQTYVHFSISIIFPFFLVGLSYLNAQYIYAIRPVLGCFIESGSNWVYVFVDGMWPVIISGVGCYFAARTSYTIIKKGLEIQSLLKYSKSGLNTAKFYRLVLFCISFLVIAFPTACITLFSNMTGSLKPYNFYELHGDFYNVQTFQDPVTIIDYVKPLTGLLVFIFFGTGRDAKQTYSRWAKKLKLDACFRFRKDELKFSDHPNNSRNFNSPSNNLTIPSTRNTNNLNRLAPPKPSFVPTRKINFFSGHRTPSEQAQFDLTSGIRIRIDGLDTRTIVNEGKGSNVTNNDNYNDDVDDNNNNNNSNNNSNSNNNNGHVLKPTPVYFKSNHNNDPNTIKIAIHNDLDSSSLSSSSSSSPSSPSSLSSFTMLNDYGDEEMPLTPPSIFPSSNFVYDGDSFGDIDGTISHIDALLSVYPKDENIPIVHVVPATPAFEEFNERYGGGDYDDDDQIESLVDNNNNNNNNNRY